MPLVIAVVIIIWLFVVIKDKGKENSREAANYTQENRKTNAELERSVLDGFMKQGLTFRESYAATQDKMVELGYEPCIPSDAYGTGMYSCSHQLSANQETSYVGGASERFDSYNVKSRRERLKEAGLPITDENVYANYPKNYAEYINDLKRQSVQIQSIAVGKWFTYPGYGTCEVLGYDYSMIRLGIGYYRVKVLQTGEIVTTIKIGDKSIRRL